MVKHKQDIEKYPNNLNGLAIELGDLRYDALSDFLSNLSNKLNKDSIADAKRNRSKLSQNLLQASQEIEKASELITQAWIICKPYMNDK